MKKSGLIGLFLMITVCTYSQKNWEDKFNGYVVTSDSVIIKGYLKFDGSMKGRGIKINLYKTPNEKPQEFYTLDLLGYVFRKDTFEIINNVHPRKDDIITLFIKEKPEKIEAIVLSRGKLILYKIPEKYYYGSCTTYGTHKYFVFAIMDVNGKFTYVESKDFLEKMEVVLKEAPDLVAKIKNKELKFKDLEKVIDSYNLQFKK